MAWVQGLIPRRGVYLLRLGMLIEEQAGLGRESFRMRDRGVWRHYEVMSNGRLDLLTRSSGERLGNDLGS